MDGKLNELLKWSVENSSSTTNTTNTDSSDPNAPQRTSSALTPEMLSALMGGPSDADLMVAAMECVRSPSPSVTLANKLVAFDNFEQLIEGLDNANNLSPLALWTPLLACLADAEPDLRRMAAWCVGTAVQNNEACQERLLAMGGVEPLCRLACAAAEPPAVRRKAVYALSSACRNYQPGMNACAAELARLGKMEAGAAAAAGGQQAVDATDMEAVDEVMNRLREEAVSAA